MVSGIGRRLNRDADCASLSGLTAAIFALGIHQEPRSDSGYPFFLCELRRHAFWMAYILDKSMATFFGRPPMINGKYCSCRMPLDVEQRDLALTGIELQDLLNTLDAAGWSTNDQIGHSTWLRGTIISLKIREEILELSLGADDDDLETKATSVSCRCSMLCMLMNLRAMKTRLETTWHQKLPMKLRNNPGCWLLHRSGVQNCFALTTHLDFLYNDFLLQRTLVKRLRCSPVELVKVSNALLSSLLVVTNNRHRMTEMNKDLSWQVCSIY